MSLKNCGRWLRNMARAMSLMSICKASKANEIHLLSENICTAERASLATNIGTRFRSSKYFPAYVSATPPLPAITTMDFFIIYPAAISIKVPTPPPIAIIPSAELAMMKSLANPIPVQMTTSQNPFAKENSSCGIMPMVNPLFSFDPMHADSITPPSPPQTKTAPARATSFPTSYARILACSVHLSLLYPTTAI